MNAPASPSIQHVRIVWSDGRSEQVRLVSIGKSGGAGEVFTIDNKLEYVAKVYHANILQAHRAEYEQKIRWMIRNPPELPPVPTGQRGIVQLAWPVAMVMQGGRFTGFVMEKIDFQRTMELDYLLTRSQAAKEGFDTDFGKLVTICHNLASLLHCLHSKKIAVVDLKPINLKVYKKELYVSILDCDGFHIHADDFVSAAPQVTPEYLAPEFHGRSVSNPENQDRFALATIIFRLLNYGIHPYAGIAANRHQLYPSELAGRIEKGLYPYGRSGNRSVRATPASVHECFPDVLRETFDRAFASGTYRASAQEWTAILNGFASKSTGAMSLCEQGHVRFTGKNCPTCLRDAILKGHAERHKRFLTRVQTSPTRAARYVRKTIRGTQTSPFQAALAQGQVRGLRQAPQTLPVRNMISIEILWIMGLAISYWWLK